MSDSRMQCQGSTPDWLAQCPNVPAWVGVIAADCGATGGGQLCDGHKAGLESGERRDAAGHPVRLVTVSPITRCGGAT